MKFPFVMGLMLFLWSFVANGNVVIRSSVEPQAPWLGQRVLLYIDVLSPDGWAQITRFGDIELNNALMVKDDTRGARLQETIDGVAHTGQRYEFSIYPQSTGSIVVPSIPVNVTVKTWGADATEVRFEDQTAKLQFTSRLPEGIEYPGRLISTHRLAAEQSWHPETSEFKVGDALTRTLVVEGEDVSGMAIAPLQLTDLTDIRSYLAEPVVSDQSTREGLTGVRTEKVTYIFEQPGNFILPDITVRWWNVNSQNLILERLSGQIIRVTGLEVGKTADAMPTVVSDESTDSRLLQASFAAVAVIVAISVLIPYVRSRRRRRRKSETYQFRIALAHMRRGRMREGLRETMRWLDLVNESPKPALFEKFLSEYSGHDAAKLVASLYRAIDHEIPETEKTRCMEALRTARAGWLAREANTVSTATSLPRFNP